MRCHRSIDGTHLMPATAAEFLAKADQCDRHAASAETEELKNQFQEIAHQWRRLAEQCDRHVASDNPAVLVSRRQEG